MSNERSFNSMIKDGDIKRADAMKVRKEDFHEEPGFNWRIEGEDLEASGSVDFDDDGTRLEGCV